ncbi:nucleoside 2-deoxyribosyltransferase domain-containing protein [Clostridium sp. KNHs214]|uniref:nucleoside 2-deoxyribosyltransferase domain-containing protein n=1 Tax=Clostridium sp. KNHs214 TaxID=1540257 RepID=UPI000A53A54C|nr:nucleoside 2-deoxyribosyltransferase domain-containing protein [Clostridium sp. KNHs214]
MKDNKMKVFLGGTCNESLWRNDLIKLLKIDYFNPVVEDWTEECMAEERKQRKECDYCLYTITPKMMGVYSIAEVVDDSNKRPNKTIFCLLETDDNDIFTKSQVYSLNQVGKMVERNGGKYFNSLKEVANYLNNN